MILDCSWLYELGIIRANWRDLMLEFEQDGGWRMLRGDPALSIVRSSLRKFSRWVRNGNECYLLDIRTPIIEQAMDKQEAQELGP